MDSLGLSDGDVEIGGSLGGGLDVKLDEDGDDILSGLTTKNDRMDKLEGSLVELKNQLETVGNSSTSTKGQVDSLKKDIEQINDSMRNLLCVYEAVSKQYNPFVDQDAPKALEMPAEPEKPAAPQPKKEAKIELPDPNVPCVDEDQEIKMALDLDAPTDKILKVDGCPAEMKEKTPENPAELPKDPEIDLNEMQLELLQAEMPEHEPKKEVLKRPKPVRMDSYALTQLYKLVDYQMGKVYSARASGEEVDQEQVEMLERGFNEFKMVGAK